MHCLIILNAFVAQLWMAIRSIGSPRRKFILYTVMQIFLAALPTELSFLRRFLS